jgi:hypothetical protein
MTFDLTHPQALAVYCSDGRFTKAIEFLLSELGHDRLDTLTIPGGAALLDLTSSSLDGVAVMRKSATFLIKGHHIKRVVLIGHEGCGYYKAGFPYESPEAMRRRQINDLERAAKWLLGEHEGLRVDMFFASPTEGEVKFEVRELPT